MATTFEQALLAFTDYLRFEKRGSQHTLLAYRTDLGQFRDYMQATYGDTSPAFVSLAFIRSWLSDLKEGGITGKSINRKISSLRGFFKFCLRQGWIDVLPTTGIIAPKISRRLPVFVKEPEMKEILKDMAAGTEDWKSLNACLLMLLFYATGMRLSELTGLKEKQVDKARSQVKILGKGNKERAIPLGEEVLQAIERYVEQKKKRFADLPPELLVTEKGRPLYNKYAYTLVNHYLKPAETLDKRSPHVLRHTFATHLMNHGADLNAVKELLGHASLAATQVYTHNTIEKLKEVHKKAHPRG